MINDLKYIKNETQNGIIVQIPSEEFSFIDTIHKRYNYSKKDKAFKKEEENNNYLDLNEEIQKNISFKKIRNKQNLSTYKTENKIIKNFSVNNYIENENVKSNNSISKIVIEPIENKKKNSFGTEKYSRFQWITKNFVILKSNE